MHQTEPAATCGDGVCDDPAFPFCDVSGAIGGVPSSCIAQNCDASAFIACDEDRLVTCSADGDDFVFTDCDHGCNADTGACNVCNPNEVVFSDNKIVSCDANGNSMPDVVCPHTCIDDDKGPHCDVLQPRYLDGVCDTAATEDFDVTQTASLDVDLDMNCNGGVIPQTGAPSICVLRYKTVSIASGSTLTFFSSRNLASINNHDGRSVALVADDLLDVSGTIDISASGGFDAPGGGQAKSGGLGSTGIGAGGAGFNTFGGPGGSSSTDGGANNGGAATGDPAVLSAFIGGPRGGGSGGGGGGAITVVACRGTIAVSGAITAGGGGGPAFQVLGTPLSGGGGGAGGYVVLQGLDIVITGGIFSNGGGGGAGAVANVQLSTLQNGRDGLASATTAADGGVAQTGAGGGGTGGIHGTNIPGKGKHSTSTDGQPGGGGGSVGFLQTYTPSDIQPTLTDATTSPSFQSNANVPTK